MRKAMENLLANKFKMNKRGVEMTLNTVIIAIIVLVILALSLFLIFGGFKGVQTGINCPSKGGRCVPDGTCDGTPVDGTCGEGNTCCTLAG